MTLTISNIPPEIEQRLRREAARVGLDEAEFVKRLIEKALPSSERTVDRATLDLLAAWDAEDETDDPAEITRRQREWEELRKSMNENSLSGRPVYP